MSATCCMILYASSFLLADPDFKCPSNDGSLQSCTETDFCAEFWNPPTYTPDQINWHYNSWTKQYSLLCDKSSMRGSYRQLIQFISAFFPLLVSSLSDSFGRVKTFNFSAIFIFSLSIFAYFISSMIMKSIAMGVLAGFEGLICSLIPIVINESMDSNAPLRGQFIAGFSAISAIGGIVLAGLTYILDDSDTLYLSLVMISLVSF